MGSHQLIKSNSTTVLFKQTKLTRSLTISLNQNVPEGRGKLSSVTAVENLSTNWKNTTSRIVPREYLQQDTTCLWVRL